MLTAEQYIEWYKKDKRRMIESGHYGSEPTFLFVESEFHETMIFNPENWCGGDILRRYFYLNWDELNVKDWDIKWFIVDGQSYVFLFHEDHFYELSWYKSRGRTDYVKKDGNPIEIEDYIELCNALIPDITEFVNKE